MDKVTIDMNKLSDKDRELVKSIVDKLENPFDIPTHEHTYYYITSRGEVMCEQWSGDSFEIECYMLGNYFLTMKEARFKVRKMQILRKLEILSQKAGGVDWGDTTTNKYYMEYNFIREFIAIDFVCVYKQQGVVYFPTEESLQEAIDLIGENNIKKYLFGVEE